jgi:phenylacetate-CoA ligase
MILRSLKIFFTSKKYSKSQFWKKDKIQKYQDEQLIKVIKHAAVHVPYYKKLFKSIELDVDNFNGREDLKKIPYLDKDTLRKNFNDFISDDSEKYGINWDSTSGSTGKPLNLLMSTATILNKKAASYRAYKLTGYKFRDKAFSIQSYKHEKHEMYRYDKITNTYMFDAKKLDVNYAKYISNMIISKKPKYLVGYPFSIFQLGKLLKDSKIEIPHVKSVITAGETLSEERRSSIQKMFKTKVYDYYSHHESVALITECSNQIKHLNEEFSYNEFIIDEKNNNIATLVGTGFYNYGMPLIRYKVDDLVELYDEFYGCQCGVEFRKIKRIIGRQNDFIQTPDGRVLGNVMEHAIDRAKGVSSSQCVQDEINHVYINLIVEEEFEESSFSVIREDLQKRIGDDITIDFNIVTELEKNKSGKTPFVLSKIGNTYL